MKYMDKTLNKLSGLNKILGDNLTKKIIEYLNDFPDDKNFMEIVFSFKEISKKELEEMLDNREDGQQIRIDETIGLDYSTLKFIRQ